MQQAEAALRQVRAGIGLSPEGTSDKVDPEETALVREAAAVLQEARQNRDRMEQLWKKEYIARAEYDASLSKLLVAEGRYQAAVEEIRNRAELLSERRSGLELAKQQLADTTLLSPIDGAVRERKASVGEYLAAGAPVVGLVKIHPLRLRVAVPERDAPVVRTGQVVNVRIEGDPVGAQGARRPAEPGDPGAEPHAGGRGRGGEPRRPPAARRVREGRHRGRRPTSPSSWRPRRRSSPSRGSRRCSW